LLFARFKSGNRSHLDLRSVADLVEQVKMVAGERNHRQLTLPPVLV
jgi:hypothetical protein